jgi:hypothetical protein
LIYRDRRFQGYDAATVIEVIEHLELNRLAAFEKVLFKFARPKLIIITTPNIEYNVRYKSLFGDLRHQDHRFESTEILSSDYFRGMVSDDENDQAATKDAFDVLHYLVAKRLAAGKLTMIDATNVQPESRQPLLKLAKQFHCFAVAIVFNLPESVHHLNPIVGTWNRLLNFVRAILSYS